MARGDFTATDAGRVEARIRSLFNGERYEQQLNRPYDAVKAALERQTASFTTISEGDVCRGVKAWYLKDCDDAVLDCTAAPINDCKVTGKQVESVAVNFDVNDCIHDGVTVYDDQCNNNLAKAEEKAAFGLAKLFAKFRHELEKKFIAFLVANATDFNGVTIDYGTVGGVDTTEIEFPAADWTADIVGKLQWLADQHGSYSPFMIDSGNLWLEEWKNKFSSQGCCTIQSLGPSGAIDLVYATKTIRSETSQKDTFLVDPDSYAFWTRNFYLNDAPINMMDEHNTHVWRMPIPGLQYRDGGSLKNVYVDMIRQRQCEISNNQHRWKTVWHPKLHFVFNLGPDICNTGETGIIHTIQT